MLKFFVLSIIFGWLRSIDTQTLTLFRIQQSLIQFLISLLSINQIEQHRMYFALLCFVYLNYYFLGIRCYSIGFDFGDFVRWFLWLISNSFSIWFSSPFARVFSVPLRWTRMIFRTFTFDFRSISLYRVSPYFVCVSFFGGWTWIAT